MQNSHTLTSKQFSEDSEVWASLKQAIAKSSGFRRWQHEHASEQLLKQTNLDHQVRCYLRETLETLAY